MHMAGLSLDQAPPYHSVQRFFLTAPIFAILASLGIMFYGGILFTSFLNFKLIGIIHWITLGFIMMSMFGAILQMLPVLAGVKIKNPVVFAGIIHAFLSLGALLFGISYVFDLRSVLPYAGIFLTIGVLLFSIHILYKLLMVKNGSHTISAMRISVTSLLMVFFLGIYLLSWRLNIVIGPGVDILSVHFLWAFIGWVTILIMGVSFQVIPMFYVSPEYPLMFRRFTPQAIIALLVLYTVITFVPVFSNFQVDFRMIIRIILYGLLASFAIITYWQVQRRKRKLPDPSLLFWKTSMGFLFLSAVLAAFMEFYNGRFYSKMILLTGMAFMFGFIYSVINGMMYKIVPFLSWFHLASKGIFEVPTMKEMIDDIRIYIQFVFHILFLLTLPLFMFFPNWGYLIPGLFLCISASNLWINLYSVIRKYNVINKKYIKSQI